MRSAGLATHYLPSRLLPELEARLHRLGEQHAAGPPSGTGSGAPPSSSASFSSAPALQLPGAAPYAGDEGSGGSSVRGRYLDLSEINDVICGLEAEAGPLPEGQLGVQLPWISRHFGGSSGGSGPALASEAVEHIISSLRQRQSQLPEGGPEAAWIGEALQALAKQVPACMGCCKAAHCIALAYFVYPTLTAFTSPCPVQEFPLVSVRDHGAVPAH